MLADATSWAYGLEAFAAELGIDTEGTNLNDAPTPTLDEHRRRQRLMELRTVVGGITLEIPPTPPHMEDAIYYSRNTLRPSHWYGIGVDPVKGVFSLVTLAEHVRAFPDTPPAVIKLFFLEPGAVLLCQAWRCAKPILNAASCSLAPCCYLSAFCPDCAADATRVPCRQCLRRARVDLPYDYMRTHAPAVRQMINDQIKHGVLDEENADWASHLVSTLATQALYRLALPRQ